MNKIIISNTEYDILLKNGGDSFIAFFSILRNAQKGNTVLKSVGRRKTTSNISYYTKLSTPTIKKYLPKLIELNMVTVQNNGNIQVRSYRYNQKHLPKVGTKVKRIPIVVENKITDTKTNSFYIRLHSNISCQKRQIEIKSKQSQLLKHHANGRIKNLKELKKAKALIRKGLSVKPLNHCLNTIFSNQSFDKLRRGHQSKQCGNYHKQKLKKKKFINSYRNKQLIFPNIFSHRAIHSLNETIDIGMYYLGYGGIYYEGVSTISVDA